MKKFFLLVLAIALISWPFAGFSASSVITTRTYAGTINGKLRVEATLKYNGKKITGTYYYLTQKKNIKLVGSTKDNKNFTINELDTKNKNRAIFKISITETPGILKGEWIDLKNKNKKYPVTLEEVSNNLAGGDKYTGHYDSGGQTFDILYLGNNKLKVQGQAYWQGVNPDNIHTGVIADVLEVKDNKVHYTTGDQEYDCVLDMTFSKDLISAKDNYMCGGMNVSFDGEYKRTSKKARDWESYNLGF